MIMTLQSTNTANNLPSSLKCASAMVFTAKTRPAQVGVVEYNYNNYYHCFNLRDNFFL